MPDPLPRFFYDRDTLDVARELLGCRLFRRIDGRILVSRVVETEAYVGREDLACHASKGLTPRTEPMFGPAGHAYVYLIYGLHHCFNVVTEAPGSGSAVLVRAVEPLSNSEERASPRMDGPGRLTKALAIDRSWNRWDLTRGEALWIEAPDRPPGPIDSGPRIGVEYAGEWAKKPWRFWLKGSPWISSPPRSARPVDRRASVEPRRLSGPMVEASEHSRPGKDRPDGP